MTQRAKTEKISVTLPKELAGEIRDTVASGQVSGFFTEALEHYLAYRKQRVALEKGFGAWKRKSHPELAAPEDSTAYVRRIRSGDRKRLERVADGHAK